MFDVPDDPAVTAALLEAAATSLRAQGGTSMVGPVTWRPDEEFGVLVEGLEHPSATGRAWPTPWYAEQLRAAGAPPAGRRPTLALATAGVGADVSTEGRR